MSKPIIGKRCVNCRKEAQLVLRQRNGGSRESFQRILFLTCEFLLAIVSLGSNIRSEELLRTYEPSSLFYLSWKFNRRKIYSIPRASFPLTILFNKSFDSQLCGETFVTFLHLFFHPLLHTRSFFPLFHLK